ncbi:MAG: sigma-54 dependent transcriptional regulator [Candidatus Marinimicrobia bacterium]|nr:sigma-54 dependent transcriptional regulator [Candidatus Neomarinimicrobiota bacterium]MCF7829329.1 sigma-54 dependent transcriptional regulator [Candidatus Neomarinimicrobiota bacterium]MCF7880009.1 sigma-54 dependent transcriptional regulator [Candidatus Neomarinimicrobiota bacterium]
MKSQLLIIDDDEQFVQDLSLLLEMHYQCRKTHTPADGLREIRSQEPDVILLDLMLGDNQNGIDVLEQIKRINEDIPVIMITDHSSIKTAVQAMQKGAFDYISKTPDMEELSLLIQKSLEQRRLKEQAQTLQEEIQSAYHEMIGISEAIEKVREKIHLFSASLNTVLISGESGVGKELVARQIHQHSQRKKKPFIALNCAAIPDQLLESELFGHEKGAFTGAESRKTGKFEIASDGIVFFDEISELSMESQAKLLRVLQEKEFERLGGNTIIETDAKIICATNRDLSERVAKGKFREDLYYRLDVLPIQVPPLRDRPADIPLLADHFVKRACREMKKPLKAFSSAAYEILQQYPWPGNIRELRNYITRAVILTEGDLIGPDDLPMLSHQQLNSETISRKIPKTWAEMDELRKAVAEEASRSVERRFISYLLEKFDGNVTKAAEHAGINRTNFHKIMKRCGVS